MPNSSEEPDFWPKAPISENERKRERLDNLVINIELTLTSIIQGVALSFLCANAAESLIHLRLDQLIYFFNALLLIFLFLVPLNWAHADRYSLATRFQSQFLLFHCGPG